MSDQDRDVVEQVAELTGEAEATSAKVEIKVEAESVVERAALEPTTNPAVTTEAGPATDERAWAALAHASALLTFILGISTGGLAVVVAALVPLVIWLAFRDRSRFVAFHAMQATIFQLASVAAWIGILVAGLVILIPTWVVTALLLVILIGFLLLPLALVLTIALLAILLVLPFASLVYGLYAAFEVYAGRMFRYWLVADWIERRGVNLTA